jgi:hypothetical protein
MGRLQRWNFWKDTMRKLQSWMGPLVGLSLAIVLSGCQSLSYDAQSAYRKQLVAEPAPGSQEAQIVLLQKATALAQGELAWESVRISDIQHDAKTVTWAADTRSMHAHCTADPDGSGPYCM